MIYIILSCFIYGIFDKKIDFLYISTVGKKHTRQLLATVNLRHIYLYLSKQWHVESQPVNPGVQWQVNPFT